MQSLTQSNTRTTLHNALRAAVSTETVSAWRASKTHFPHSEVFLLLLTLEYLDFYLDSETPMRERIEFKFAFVIELARLWPSLHLSFSGFALFLVHMLNLGSQRHWDLVMPAVRAGRCCAWALTGDKSGSSPQLGGVKAIFKDGEWRLSGKKLFITNAQSAAWIIVIARTGENFRKLTAFLIPENQPGMTINSHTKEAMEGSETCELEFSDCRISPDMVLGAVDNALKEVMPTLTECRLTFGLGSLGIALGTADLVKVWFNKRTTLYQGEETLLRDVPRTRRKARLIGAIIGLISFLFDQAAESLVEDGPKKAFLAATCAKKFSGQLGLIAASIGAELFGGASISPDTVIFDYFKSAHVIRVGEGSETFLESLLGKAKFTPRVFKMKLHIAWFYCKWSLVLTGLR